MTRTSGARGTGVRRSPDLPAFELHASHPSYFQYRSLWYSYNIRYSSRSIRNIWLIFDPTAVTRWVICEYLPVAQILSMKLLVTAKEPRAQLSQNRRISTCTYLLWICIHLFDSDIFLQIFI